MPDVFKSLSAADRANAESGAHRRVVEGQGPAGIHLSVESVRSTSVPRVHPEPVVEEDETGEVVTDKDLKFALREIDDALDLGDFESAAQEKKALVLAAAKSFSVPKEACEILAQRKRWVIRDLVGAGSMGAVYKAFDLNMRRTSALKLFSPGRRTDSDLDKAKKRFIREGRALAKLNSPYVTKVYDQEVADSGAGLLAMKLVDGEDLDRRMLGEGPRSVQDASRIGFDIAKGLEAMHAAGVVHRDLKPANVVYSNEEQHHVIVDFGLVHLLADPRQEWDRPSGKSAPEHERLTDVRFVMGTPRYMAPEQVVGRKTITPAADVWALGVILFELTTGKVPFELNPDKKKPLSAGEYAVKVAREEVPALTGVRPDLPPDFTQLVMNMLEKDPRDRPTIAEVLVELKVLAGEERPEKKQATKGETRRPATVERKNVGADPLATPSDAFSSLNRPAEDLKTQARQRVEAAFLKDTDAAPVIPPAPSKPKPATIKDALPWRIWNRLLGRK